ncbi:MAG: caspase family protein [bacterium]|nr:caspase family protein [bacterium]
MNRFEPAFRIALIECRGLFVAVALAVALLTSGAAHAEKRVALVVGNSNYRSIGPLDNPRNDAKLMAETLRGIGFTLIGDREQLDLDKASLDSAVQSFGSALAGADVALFYYAGHGVQVRGSNYMVPVGANPTREADVDFQMVDLALVLRQMEGSGTRLNLMILDACRNNPFGSRGLRATSGGLAQMTAPEGTLISYATQPGNVAQDGADGNSPYTKALAATIRRAGLEIFETFNEVGLAVKRSTRGQQQPWLSSSPIDGKFYFVPATTSAPAAASAENEAALAWNAVKDSTNPAALDAFIRRYRTSFFAELARARLDELKAAGAKPQQQVAALPGPGPIAIPTVRIQEGSRQRVVLYDEDPNDPKGRQYVGSVVWRTAPFKTAGQPDELAAYADIEVPDRKLKLTMSLNRNGDKSLPASHVLELRFKLPADFAGGGIGNVPGMLMKTNEQARGSPLAALAVKVTEGFFLVGLSNVPSDRSKNLELLDRAWFDIPMVYSNQRRAILAIEKGPTGTSALNAALGKTNLSPPPVAVAAPSSGSYLVQVGSQRSETDAQESYKALQGKYPEILGTRTPVIKRSDLGANGIYYRVMIGPFDSSDEASQFCGGLKTAGGQCIVLRN